MTPTAADAPGATAAPARPFVTIAMPCLDEARFIEGCLRSVQAQTYPRDRLEILVADGGSTDGTRDVLARLAAEDPRIRVVDNPQRIQAAGLNRVIRAARGDVHRADGRARGVRAGLRREVRRGARAHGRRQRRRAPSAAQRGRASSGPCARRSAARSGWAARRTATRAARASWTPSSSARSAATCSTASGSTTRARSTNEDAEINQRLVQSGGRIYLSRDIHVRYFPRESFAALARQYFRYGRGRARTLLKHRRVLKLRPVLPFLALVGGIALLLVSPRLGARRRRALRARHRCSRRCASAAGWGSPASPRPGSSSPSCSSRRRSGSGSGLLAYAGRIGTSGS